MESFNIEAEQEEKKNKDERKKLREWRQVDTVEALCRVRPGCVVMAVSE